MLIIKAINDWGDEAISRRENNVNIFNQHFKISNIILEFIT